MANFARTGMVAPMSKVGGRTMKNASAKRNVARRRSEWLVSAWSQT